MPTTTFGEDFFQSRGTQDVIELLTELVGTPSSGASREQAIADTQGLVSKAVRDFEQSILPQLMGAQEGAGASGGAVTALLAQEAGIASAGQVAEKQLAQILGAQNIQSQERGQSLDALTELLQQLTQGDIARQRSTLDILGRNQGPQVSNAGPRTTLGPTPSFVNPGPIYGPSSSQPTFSGRTV